jgi:HEAT repeat protein
MKNALIIILLVFVCSVASLASEDTEISKEENKEKIASQNEDRRDVLNYGIDSEIISLIADLKDEENKILSPNVADIYADTLNPDIMKVAVDYFISIDYSDAVPAAEEIIENWEDENFNTLSSALRYISEYPNDNSEDLISVLIDHENKSLASAALAAIGKCGSEKTADLLLDNLDDDDYPEELKPSLIRALGDMKSEGAIDTLIEILDDIDEEKSWRWTACEALGKIGHPDAMPAIENALLDKDTYLRSYAIKALAGFDEDGVVNTLIQALRDSFWRVRVSAAESLGERKSTEAVGILIYKAKKDPENNVKVAAVKALGEIGGTESFDFLRQLYAKSTTVLSLRSKAAEILVEKDLQASIDSIKKVIAEEWEKETSAVLSYTCKYLSKAENPALKEFFSKMLDHNDVAIKIYGIRGIQLNQVAEQKERIEALTEEGINNAVRKAALSALENL